MDPSAPSDDLTAARVANSRTHGITLLDFALFFVVLAAMIAVIWFLAVQLATTRQVYLTAIRGASSANLEQYSATVTFARALDFAAN